MKLLYLLMYIIRVMIFTFSIKDFGHPKFGHPDMKILKVPDVRVKDL